MTQKYQYLFTPLDTWFFREAYPYSVAGARELYSVFPPPARAVMGAIRALIAEHTGIDWDNYQTDIAKNGLDQEIGKENDFGKLVLQGPYLRYQDQRLAPAPLFLMQTNSLAVLKPGTPVECDLGKKVKLPVLETRGAKSLEHTWLTTEDLRDVLKGHLPTSEKLINAKEKLYNEERHLGIALDHQRYVTKTGQLYETRHLRLLPDVVIEAVVSGISPELHPVGKQSVRLGGESRMALVEVKPYSPDMPIASSASVDNQKSDRNILIMLLTSADLGSSWLPSETFKPIETETETVWRGELFGIPLEIISATIGKVLREGGWDIQGRKSRPNKSLIPAGSAWFARMLNNQTVVEAMTALSGRHIGLDPALGQGEITVGIW
jgi:CRISPR-associated protein Cmr3